MIRRLIAIGALLALTSCRDAPYDPRGVEADETLLSVSATGQTETRPDEAQFQAGINTWAASAKSASEINQTKIDEIVASLEKIGVEAKDIQTRVTSVQRVDWGEHKGQYQASNVANITIRNVDKAGAAVAAVTSAGANIVSGPDLRMADPEKAATLAYTSAYKQARARAEAYAEAAGMKISRVLSIRDSGGSQGNHYLPGAMPPPPRPVMAEQAARDASATIMPGQTKSAVAIQVDFALQPK